MSDEGLYEEDGTATNTGPKGVINDWRKFKLESVDQESLPPSKRKLFQQMSSAHKLRDHSLNSKMSVEEYKLLKEDDEQGLSQYRERCMREMRESLSTSVGGVQELASGEDFLSMLEQEHLLTVVVVLVYRETVRGCQALNTCLDCLAAEYPTVRFCRVDAAASGASERFSDDVLPAVLVYKGGEMLGNFLTITQHFGEEFFAADVENFLREYGLLPEKASRAGELEEEVD